jgi:ABC-type bacteriocin/lantibiotic exporter with double-glycine peptidase domain
MIKTIKSSWFEFKKSSLISIFSLLDKKDRAKIAFMTFYQICFSFFDVIGVGIFGVIGSLAVAGGTSRPTGDRVNRILELAKIQDFTVQKQVAILGTLASVLLISKTLLSLYFTKKTMFFLSYRTAQITKILIAKLLSLPLEKIQKRSLQENIYALTGGVSNLTNQIIGSVVITISDFFLVLIMILGLFYVDPIMCCLTILIFGGVAISLYLSLHSKAKTLGQTRASLTAASIELIQEVFGTYREAVVSNRRPYYINTIGEQQYSLARNSSEIGFLPSISKYILEISIILGTLIIGAIQFLRQDAMHSVITLSVFIAASSRIAPAILRIQQNAISIRNSIASSGPTFKLIKELEKIDLPELKPVKFNNNHEGSWNSIEIKDVTFKYEAGDKNILSNINLKIPFGNQVSIIGKSGSGKTTLVDIILGINVPQYGQVSISGLTPSEIAKLFPGSMTYVPQDSIIVNGTIRSNVCLGYDAREIGDELIYNALEMAELKDFVLKLPNKLDQYIGDRGSRISGGQRQRLGIARALISSPKIIVMDEATSALDAETEKLISDTIDKLRGKTTVILIAHRLATVQKSDLVVYLENGKILMQGKPSELEGIFQNSRELGTLIGE